MLWWCCANAALAGAAFRPATTMIVCQALCTSRGELELDPSHALVNPPLNFRAGRAVAAARRA